MSDQLDTSEPQQRIVGVTMSAWYFPELDQWKLPSWSRNTYGNLIIAIGPLRFMFKPVHIWR